VCPAHPRPEAPSSCHFRVLPGQVREKAFSAGEDTIRGHLASSARPSQAVSSPLEPDADQDGLVCPWSMGSPFALRLQFGASKPAQCNANRTLWKSDLELSFASPPDSDHKSSRQSTSIQSSSASSTFQVHSRWVHRRSR